MHKSLHNHCDKLTANPLMALLVGGTGSGKTYLLFQMLTTPGTLDFERLVVLTSTPNQAYFQFLKHGFDNSLTKPVINKLFQAFSIGVVKGDTADLCHETSKLSGVTQHQSIPVVLTKEITDLAQLNPEAVKTLVIFDNCVTERNQSIQCDLFTKL